LPANHANRRECLSFALIRVIRGPEIKLGCGYAALSHPRYPWSKTFDRRKEIEGYSTGTTTGKAAPLRRLC
jgi:hypothetical protein